MSSQRALSYASKTAAPRQNSPTASPRSIPPPPIPEPIPAKTPLDEWQ